MRYLIITQLFLLASFSLVAQQADAEGPQRWYFSTSFGLDTYPGFYTGSEVTGSNLALSELGFRVHRHLDLGVQVGLMSKKTAAYNRIVTPALEGEWVLASWNSQQRNLFVGLQGKLNYRVGQGDLSLTSALGLLRHSNLVQASSPFPFRAELRMAPLITGYHFVQIGYTYWATPKFGLILGFSIFTQDTANTTRNVEFGQGGTPFYTIKNSDVEGLEVPDEDFMSLRLLNGNKTTHYIMVGLTARIF